MRVIASSPPAAAAQRPADVRRAERLSDLKGLGKFLEFRKDFKARSPELAWRQFRQVARSIFGEAALLKEPLKGEDSRRLALSASQLEHLAKHPGTIRRHVEKLQAEGTLPKDSAKWKAKNLPGLVSRTAKAATDGKAVFTVATVNDDFTDRKTNLKGIKADVMLVQEAKNTNLRKALSDKHGVHQNVKRDDKAGSAVVWKRGEVKAGKRGYELGVEPKGAGMLRRWISWTDVKVDGQNVRMVSVHRPPKRFSHLWPAFDRNLAAFVKDTKGKIVIGMDANQQNPRAMAKRCGLKWQAPKGSIDGFLVSPGIRVKKLWRLPKGTSDHHPVVAKLEITK